MLNLALLVKIFLAVVAAGNCFKTDVVVEVGRHGMLVYDWYMILDTFNNYNITVLFATSHVF